MSFHFYTSIQEDISAIFSKADKNNTGKLNVKDLKEVVKDICERYPQVEIYLNKKQLKNINVLLKNAEEDPKKASMEFDIEKFKKALSEVDSQMKHLPATAQVKLENLFSSDDIILPPTFDLIVFCSVTVSSNIVGCCSRRCLSCKLFQSHGAM